MPESEAKNPYFAEHGCEDHHEMATTGFGITLSTIKYWLFEQKLETKIQLSKDAIAALKDAGYSIQEIEEPDDQEIMEFVTRAHQEIVSLCTFSNRDDEILMVYGKAIRDDKDKTLLPTAKEVVDNIMIAIKDLFNVPDNKIPKLKNYVTKHTDYINVTDYS